MASANTRNPIDLRFLKDCEVLSGLSEEILRVVYNRGQTIKIEPGGFIFNSGELSDRFFVIKTGIVEICREDEPGKQRALAYLGSSCSLGEISLLTGATYNSSARMPEGGEIFSISRNVFLSLLDMLPEFGKALSTLFAHRLSSMAKESRIDRREQFGGSLKFFDLPTIIQTIVVSGLTGILNVFDGSDESVAEISFEKGAVRGAILGPLTGEDAFYQLFQPPIEEGTFHFKSGPPKASIEGNSYIEKPPTALLIDAARQQDELIEIRRKIDEEDVFTTIKEKMLWLGDEQFLVLAGEIFAALKKESMTPKELISRMRRCAYAIYSIIKLLEVTKQIERVKLFSVRNAELKEQTS